MIALPDQSVSADHFLRLFGKKFHFLAAERKSAAWLDKALLRFLERRFNSCLCLSRDTVFCCTADSGGSSTSRFVSLKWRPADEAEGADVDHLGPALEILAIRPQWTQ